MDLKATSSPQRFKIIYIPDELFEKNAAQRHFQQFGPCKVKLIAKRKSCLVEYDNYDNAQSAILNAGEYLEYVFSVNWYNSSTKKKAIKKDKDPEWIPDSDIQDELQAMAATGVDYKITRPLRSEDPQKTKVKKTWKPEPAKKTPIKPNVNSNAWTSEELEFLNILKQPAFSIEEKFKVLEARDKLIRLRTKKEANVTKSTKSLVGNCPDMCPEKERIMREIQHQVASYEQDANGKLNPALAIKQYSRSSADQEVPLPHELRPVSVLQLTMGYLMHCIMDLSDASLTDWYHFLWDRTRGIRKDITQQELCSQGSVVLIEQCARFHVHCSARLVAEDPSVFDQKINTENLTKCLQTLKYMYHDLNLKGESCPNEAEFRAYIILLNLNDGNFMWEVQQLKQEIQKSPQVKFALAVYSAIEKNNYVKFFKLVQSTNYLNACILLRYFVQVRTKALSTIVKSYSPARMPYTSFPLNELTALLAFEDVDSTVDFVTCYGLFLNELETHVVLDRKNFQLPELPYSLERAISFIESKRTRSVGEVICGSSLPYPAFKNHTPHNSFAENGLFIMEGVLKDAIRDAKRSQDQTDSTYQIDELPRPLKPILSEPTATTMEVSSNIFKTQPDSNQIFGRSKSPSIFGQQATPDQLNSSEEQKTNLFMQLKPSQQGHQQRVNIFKQPEQKLSHFFNQNKNIFGQQSQTDSEQEQRQNIFAHQTNIFALPEKPSIFGNQNFDVDKRSGASIFEGFNESNQFPQPVDIFSNKASQSSINPNLITFDVDEPESPPFEAASDPVPPLYTFIALDTQKQERAEQEQRLRELAEVKRKELEEQQHQEENRLKELKKLEEERKELEHKKHMEEQERRRAIQKRLELEKQKRLEKERLRKVAEEKKAFEAKRLLELEIQQSVESLLEDLLTKVEEGLFLDKIADKNKALKMKLFLEKWQKKSKSNKRKRMWMEENPIWLPSRTVSEEAQELITKSQQLALGDMKRYKLGASIELTPPKQPAVEKLGISYLYKVLLESYTKEHRGFQKEIFWKVTVSLPSGNEFRTGLRHIEELATQMFQWPDRYGNTKLIGQHVAENRFSYCFERKQGVCAVRNDINGLLFVADEPNEFLFQRLTTALESLSSLTQVPVTVIFINNSEELCLDDFEEVLDDNPQISAYKTLKINFSLPMISNAIELGLEFLAQSISNPPPLHLDALESFLHLHVSELWKRITTYTEWNSKYKWCLRSPEVAISLYNEAIERLKVVLLDEASLAYQDFSKEFIELLLDQEPDVLPCDYRYFPNFWKTQRYRNILSHTIDLFKIPKYQLSWPPSNEKQLEKDVYHYCKSIFEEPQRPFYNTMAVLLQDVDPVEGFQEISNVLWVDVMQVLFLERLSTTNFSLQSTEFHKKSIFQQIFVVYNVQVLDKFRGDDWFYLTNVAIQEEIVKIPPSEKQQARQTPVFDVDLDEIEKSLQDEEKDLERRHRLQELKKMKHLMKDLEESMEIQRDIYKTINKRLKLDDTSS